MSAESLPPFDGSSQTDIVQQYVVHGLLTALAGNSPKEHSRRVLSVFSFIDEQCGTGFAKHEDFELTLNVPPSGTGESSIPVPHAQKRKSLASLEPLGKEYGVLPVRRRLGPRIRRLAWPAAIAAGIVLAVAMFWWTTPAVRADIYADAANAGTAFFYFLRDATGLFADDPDSAAAYQREMVEARQKRDHYKLIFERNPQAANAPIVPLFSSWQGLYCGLRDGGDVQAAVQENQAALTFCQAWSNNPHVGSWEPILLDGLANTLAAAGDDASAHDAYLQSLAFRKKNRGNRSDPHRDEPGYEGHIWDHVMPLYLRLSMLAIAQENLVEARDWWLKAERVFGDHLATVCELDGITLGRGATVWEKWLALPAEYRAPRTQEEYAEQESAPWPTAWAVYPPNESMLHRLGELLYHDAVIYRLEGSIDAAAESLDRAATLEDWLTAHPGNDELRLPFLLRIERARLAIIRHDFRTANSQLDAADSYAVAIRRYIEAADAGAVETDPIPAVNKLPISPTRRAEARLLRGIALAGLASGSTSPRQATRPSEANAQQNQSSRSRATSLIESALELPRKLAEHMSPGDRAKFLRQFEAWHAMARSARGSQL